MISFALLKRDMATGVKPFIIIFAVLCLYTTVIIYMFNPELASMLSDYQEGTARNDGSRRHDRRCRQPFGMD